MRAWRVHELGDPRDVLRIDDVDEPRPGPGELLVHIEATALNFPDILLCQGKYQERPPLPFTPGLEVAGTVLEAGEGTQLPPGQRVAALPGLPYGGLAERVVVPERAAFPIPDTLDSVAAAALPIAYQTSHFALHRRARLQPGEVLLVHAGAGGVGSAAIQLGVAAGARVIATAGGAEKIRICRELGAELAVDYTTDDFVERVKDATGGRGADVIYDPVGGDVFDRSRKCIAWEGRLLVIGFAGGRIPEIPANHVLLKNYAVVGLHWGLYNRVAPHLVREVHDDLMRLHSEGRIAPLIHHEAAFEEVPAALVQLGGRGTWGKVVVRPPVPKGGR